MAATLRHRKSRRRARGVRAVSQRLLGHTGEGDDDAGQQDVVGSWLLTRVVVCRARGAAEHTPGHLLRRLCRVRGRHRLWRHPETGPDSWLELQRTDDLQLDIRVATELLDGEPGL